MIETLFKCYNCIICEKPHKTKEYAIECAKSHLTEETLSTIPNETLNELYYETEDYDKYDRISLHIKEVIKNQYKDKIKIKDIEVNLYTDTIYGRIEFEDEKSLLDFIINKCIDKICKTFHFTYDELDIGFEDHVLYDNETKSRRHYYRYYFNVKCTENTIKYFEEYLNKEVKL